MLSRVLHVTPSFFPATKYGGPVTALYDLCRAQQAAGLAIRVLTSDAAGKKTRLAGLSGGFVTDYGVSTLYARATLGEDLAPQLLPSLIRELPWADIVHVTGLWSPTSLLGILGAVCAVGRRKPCVVSPRGALLPWALRQSSTRKQLFLRLFAPVLRHVAGWHATSEEEASAIRNLDTPRLVGRAATVAVVPNGIAVPPLAAPAFGAPIIVALGRLHPVKNLELALEALALLRRSEPRARLRIIGSSDEQPHYGPLLRDKAAALGIADSVQFDGEIVGEAKLAALRAASLLWLCSHMESFGNVVLEALSVGTPVVAAQTTPWQSLDEIGAGRCVSATAEAFVEATRTLLAEQSSESQRVDVARRCQAAVRQRYSFSAVESRMRSLYEQALRVGTSFRFE